MSNDTEGFKDKNNNSLNTRLVLGEFLGQNNSLSFSPSFLWSGFDWKTDIMGLWAGYFCILINMPELCSGMWSLGDSLILSVLFSSSARQDRHGLED